MKFSMTRGQRWTMLVVVLAAPALAQPPIPSRGIFYVTSDPSGSCGYAYITVNRTTGNEMGCVNGTWASIGGGGGGGSGTVTNITTTGPITGGPINTTGAIGCVTCGVTGSPLSQFAATTSAQLRGIISDETGTGTAVFNNGPTFIAPILGTPASGNASNLTNFPTLNQNTSGTAANLSGTPALPNGTAATTQSQNDNSTKLSTTAYTDLAVANAVAGVNPAVAVLAASTAALTGTYSNGVAGVGATFTITATGTFSLDGIAINTIGQRVLLKNQSSAFQNGVYTATVIGASLVSPVFTRALDYDQPSDMNNTGAIPVQSGTVNSTTSWLLTSTVNTVGTDALTYALFSVSPPTLPAITLLGSTTLVNTAYCYGFDRTVTVASDLTAASATATVNLATVPANWMTDSVWGRETVTFALSGTSPAATIQVGTSGVPAGMFPPVGLLQITGTESGFPPGITTGNATATIILAAIITNGGAIWSTGASAGTYDVRVCGHVGR